MQNEDINSQFINEYIQILSSNLDATNKASVILQAKYNILDRVHGQANQTILELRSRVEELESQFNSAQESSSSNGVLVETIREEKQRIQDGLNYQMRMNQDLLSKLDQSNSELEFRNAENEQMRSQIANLIAENTALKEEKKIPAKGKTKSVSKETTIKSGGSF